jgi:hypothetical protein
MNEEDDQAILQEQEDERVREAFLLADPQLRKMVHVTTHNLRGMDLGMFSCCLVVTDIK